MINEETQELLQRNLQDPNLKAILQAKKTPKESQPSSGFEKVCNFIQLVIFIFLIYLLIKFALMGNNKRRTPEVLTPMMEDPQLLLPESEDNNILQFLMNPEQVDTLEPLEEILEQAEESLSELEFEADPWHDEQQNGWIFKNGLTLVVKELSSDEAQISFIINHGYHEDLLNTDYMNTIMKYMQLNQCTKDVEIHIDSFKSGLKITTTSDQVGVCLEQLDQSLNTEFDQELINQIQLVPPSYDSLGLILDVMNQCADDRISIPIKSTELQAQLDNIIKNSAAMIMVQSSQNEQDVYMMVSDSHLIETTFGTAPVESLDLESLLYNVIKLQSDYNRTTLIYPIKVNQADFFIYLLQLNTLQSFQVVTNTQITVALYDQLALQTSSMDSIRIAQDIYSFASFLKRTSDKILMNMHKDYINLMVAKQQYVNKEEFSKKLFLERLDLIQQGLIIVIEQSNYQYSELATVDSEDYLTSTLVNKKFINLAYSHQLFDFMKIANPDEQLIAQFKLPILAPYIPLDSYITQLYSEQQIVATPIDSVVPLVIISDDNNTIPVINQIENITVVPVNLDSTKYRVPNRIPIQYSQELWWQFENETNKVFMGLQIYRNPSLNMLNSKAMLKVAQRYIEESLQHSDFLQAGFTLSLESSYKGLAFSLSGWSSTFNTFLSHMIQEIKQIDNITRFTTIKESLKLDFNRFYTERMQFYALQYLFPKLMLRPVNEPSEIINAIDSLEYDTFQQFLNGMFNDIHYTALISGNTAPDDIKLIGTPNSIEYVTKTLHLDGSVYYPIQVKFNLVENKQSALLVYYSAGPRTPKNMAALLLLQEYFTTIETDINVSFKSVGCVDGLLFYSQGVELPWKTAQRLAKLVDKPINNIDQLRESLSLHYDHSGEYVWDKILQRNYAFSEIDDIREALPNVTVDDLSAILHGGSLNIHIYGAGMLHEDFNTYIKSHGKGQEYSTQTSHYECKHQHQSQ